jgi:hypothetical protein
MFLLKLTYLVMRDNLIPGKDCPVICNVSKQDEKSKRSFHMVSNLF